MSGFNTSSSATRAHRYSDRIQSFSREFHPDNATSLNSFSVGGARGSGIPRFETGILLLVLESMLRYTSTRSLPGELLRRFLTMPSEKSLSTIQTPRLVAYNVAAEWWQSTVFTIQLASESPSSPFTPGRLRPSISLVLVRRRSPYPFFSPSPAIRAASYPIHLGGLFGFCLRVSFGSP